MFTGVLGSRGFALESAVARVCREAGSRVATNMFARNMDLGVPRAADSRRLEVVVDRLPLLDVQLAVDTTLVSALKSDGAPRRGTADHDGVPIAEARRTRERTLSEEAKILVRLLARARARSRLMQRRVEQAWRLRWYAIISCAAAKSLAASLLGWRGEHGSDGFPLPSHEVERDQAVALSE